MAEDLIVLRPQGLYCPAGDFHIDPWRAVPRAVITHAHADHARAGHGHYLAASPGATLLRARLPRIALQTLGYGQRLRVRDVCLSLHPAGHVPGSAQVRIESGGQVWVVSGDYFVSGAGDINPTCDAFEPQRADVFVTESTFGLPVYRWRAQREVLAEVQRWWSENAASGRPSVLRAYSLGKAQRVLAGLDPSIGPIAVHPAVQTMNEAYRAAGIPLPRTSALEALPAPALRRALVIAPPMASTAPALEAQEDRSEAFASGWMQLGAARRRQGLERGFVLSDHADWPGLLEAIAATGAGRVIVMHGQEAVLVRWLEQQGLRAERLRTAFGTQATSEST